MRTALAIFIAGIISSCSGPLHASTAVTVTSAFSSGPGSVREAIEKANAADGPVRIVSALEPGTVVYVFRELPPLRGRKVTFEANRMVLRGGDCIRAGGQPGCSGLVVRGQDVTVRELHAAGFQFDGIAVRGEGTRGVRIVDCYVYENEDDGIGVSDHAADVVVESSRMERNGFGVRNGDPNKGKGILVFDYAQAELRNNLVRYNRDGVTISKRSKVRMLGNRIVENYDKGFGVAGAECVATDNTVARNGRPSATGERPPNGDGIRITIDSRVELIDFTVSDNGDAGLVAVGSPRVRLVGGTISGNGSIGVSAAGEAQVEIQGTVIDGNGKGSYAAKDAAIISDGKTVIRDTVRPRAVPR